MSDVSYFWLGFSAGVVCGAVIIIVVVEFARWLYNRRKWW